MDTHLILGNVYSCDIKSIGKIESAELIVVNGTHDKNKTIADVVSVFLQGKKGPTTVPTNVGKQFPGIKAFGWLFAGVKTVAANDLKQFANLEVLELCFNDLEVLESNLFSNTPNLKVINFRSNRLQKISPDLLNGLANLERAIFDKNPCIDFHVDIHRKQNKTSFDDLKKSFAANCTGVAVTAVTGTTGGTGATAARTTVAGMHTTAEVHTTTHEDHATTESDESETKIDN